MDFQEAKIVGTEFGTLLDANYSVLVNMITPLQVTYFCFARKQIDHSLDFVLKFIYSEKATKIVLLRTIELYLSVGQANLLNTNIKSGFFSEGANAFVISPNRQT